MSKKSLFKRVVDPWSGDDVKEHTRAKENKMFEGILRPEPMGVLIPKEIALNEISQEVLDYINLRGIRLIRVNNVPIKS